MEKKPTVLHSKVVVANKSTGRQEMVLQSSRTAQGLLIASDKKAEDNFYDGFCVIDWSLDSRYLLVERMQGPLGSDFLWFETWVYDTQARRKHMINVSVLRREVENYWRKKGTNPGSYHLKPAGWETENSDRVVFTASPAYWDDIYLGIWSISRDGRHPRLLLEESEKYVAKQFGKLEGSTSWFPKTDQ